MFRAVFSLAKKLSADQPCVVFIDEVLLVLIFICNLSLSAESARTVQKVARISEFLQILLKSSTNLNAG
jgi:hypothetical protein